MVTMESMEDLLASARRVGPDYCWPASKASEAVRGLAALGAAVVGAEFWQLDSANRPLVLGWSTYDVPLHGRWVDVVDQCMHEALGSVRSLDGILDAWIALTWITELEIQGDSNCPS